MSRATYCRDQARLCRELAAQLSVPHERASLGQMADRYEAESHCSGIGAGGKRAASTGAWAA